MNTSPHVLLAIGLAAALSSTSSRAAVVQCPPQYGVGTTNLAENPSFETATRPVGLVSAAKGWTTHTDNAGSPVSSQLVTTTAPGPNGAKMLRFVSHGVESGVYQSIPTPPAKMMFSAWVFVKSGMVTIQQTAGLDGPFSSSTKTGEWEQLRVCSDGTQSVDTLVIYNQAAGGGEFYVDRVEARALQ